MGKSNKNNARISSIGVANVLYTYIRQFLCVVSTLSQPTKGYRCGGALLFRLCDLNMPPMAHVARIDPGLCHMGRLPYEAIDHLFNLRWGSQPNAFAPMGCERKRKPFYFLNRNRTRANTFSGRASRVCDVGIRNTRGVKVI